MPGKGRKHENDPGKYMADLFGVEQKKSSRRKPKAKQGRVTIGGNTFSQDTMFQGDEIRIPFPDAPVNKIPDRIGMTRDKGTLFTLPETPPDETQTELFSQPIETAHPFSLPVDPQVGKLPDDLIPFVTYVPLHLLSTEQRKKGIVPYVTTTFFVYRSERNGYVPGIMLVNEQTQEKIPLSYGVTSRPADIQAAYERIRKAIDYQGLRTEATPEPEGEKNPLLSILKEDEIYIDPFEVTIEEAEENGYPLLRRDVVTYTWWLEFPFDTREQPELYQALKDTKWKWGSYRKQWFNPSHFPTLPKEMYYANAGGAFYSEENAERIEARATKAHTQSTTHYERSNTLASVIPFGQPMMPDHYSYRSDLSYRKKIWRQMDLFVAFYKKAEWLDNRAEGSRRLQRRTTNISMMQNRLDRLHADVRLVRRNYVEAKQLRETDLDYYRYRLTILASEILPLQAAITERGGLAIDKVAEERPLQPGDLIQIRGSAMYVVKVNQKTIKVADPKVHDATGKMWELTYKKSDFQRILATKEELEARKNQSENAEETL
jgi:Domain of unknown function (DUF3560)